MVENSFSKTGETVFFCCKRFNCKDCECRVANVKPEFNMKSKKQFFGRFSEGSNYHLQKSTAFILLAMRPNLFCVVPDD